MVKTKRFQNGKFFYSIKYNQFQMNVIDEDTGEEKMELVHQEVAKYIEFPFYIGCITQFGRCDDTGQYYRS